MTFETVCIGATVRCFKGDYCVKTTKCFLGSSVKVEYTYILPKNENTVVQKWMDVRSGSACELVLSVFSRIWLYTRALILLNYCESS